MRSRFGTRLQGVLLGAASSAGSGSRHAGPGRPDPPGWEASNMQPVGYSGVDNRKGAFKMAIKKVNGRWYMYVSHLWHYGWSILDVTDPRDPKVVKFIPGSDNTWNIQVTLQDNLMLTALQKSAVAWGADPKKPWDEGVLLYQRPGQSEAAAH